METNTTISPRRSQRSAARQANEQLYGLCRVYHKRIPLTAIFGIARLVGEPIQEDGMPWSGILCGREGRASIDLQDSKI